VIARVLTFAAWSLSTTNSAQSSMGCLSTIMGPKAEGHPSAVNTKGKPTSAVIM
jgi:hypothetical protein